MDEENPTPIERDPGFLLAMRRLEEEGMEEEAAEEAAGWEPKVAVKSARRRLTFDAFALLAFGERRTKGGSSSSSSSFSSSAL